MGIWDVYPQELVNDVISLRVIKGDQIPIDKSIELLSISDIDEIYSFLCKNYTNSDVLNVYSKELLLWYLFGVGIDSCLLCIKENNRIVGFICGVERILNFYNKNISIIEVNFLCIDKKYRSKMITKRLIDGLWSKKRNFSALFTVDSDRGIPKSFSSIGYYMYPLCIDKLVAANFFEIPDNKLKFIKGLKKRYSNINTSLRKVKLDDIHDIYDRLIHSYIGKVHIEISLLKFIEMYKSGCFEMYCTDDLSSFVCIYTTIERRLVDIKIGNVYLYYGPGYILDINCDLMVFPKNYTNVSGLRYNNLNFHLFQHTSKYIDSVDNMISII
jgi:hypothetical protein